MNPLTTISSSGLTESTQRIDATTVSNPPTGTDQSREQQVRRAEQPASSVSVAISDAARARASDDLATTETVAGSNASSQSDNQTRNPQTSTETVGQLVDERA